MKLKKFVAFFDKLEDKVRGRLSHYPIFYGIVGGVGIVLFWRGVWHTADDLNVGSLVSLIIGAVILLITGVFVSAFVGNRLIISGLFGGKKIAEQTQEEIEAEEAQIKNLQRILDKVEKEVAHLEEDMHKK
jgi:hypothetical protein